MDRPPERDGHGSAREIFEVFDVRCHGQCRSVGVIPAQYPDAMTQHLAQLNGHGHQQVHDVDLPRHEGLCQSRPTAE
ncbi:Uncharacterised protein [Mycobacteroides abscessus subsp. massiliense]|nr:Uncharacterised protein [Mycobacteroides abscessus subsp. massiliense]